MKLKTSDVAVYRRLLGYIKKFSGIFILAIVANCIYSGIDASFVYFLKPIVNRGIVGSEGFITWLALLVVVGFFFRSLFNVIASYSLSYVTSSIVMILRQELFAKFQKLPASYYDHSSSGKMISEMIYSVDQVSSASADAVQNFLQSLTMVVGLVVVMCLISFKLTLIFMVMFPFIGLLIKFTSKRIRRISHDIQDVMKTVTSITEENVEGYKIVRFCGAQSYEIKKFNFQTWLSRNKMLKIVLSRTSNSSTVQLLGGVALALMILVAGIEGQSLKLSPGDFASLAAAMLTILKPLKNLTNLNAIIQTGLAGASSVFKTLDYPDEIDTGTVTVARAKGHVEYRHVNFSYEPIAENVAKPVLHEINFIIEPGQVIALVGRSGGGKSTLVSLLPRFYDVTSGGILVDGVDIREYTLPSLRKQFALVSQSVVLFDDTIASNIAYGYSDTIDQGRLLHAAKAAHALEFIEKLPQGFDSLVGDNGILLSGGQRQRLAIARAIYQDAPILILDEATSALDTEAERHIQEALSELMKTRTTIVIAHRLSTIENADKIYVVDEGRIVEGGSHQELLSKQGVYSKLYKDYT